MENGGADGPRFLRYAWQPADLDRRLPACRRSSSQGERRDGQGLSSPLPPAGDGAVRNRGRQAESCSRRFSPTTTTGAWPARRQRACGGGFLLPPLPASATEAENARASARAATTISTARSQTPSTTPRHHAGPPIDSRASRGEGRRTVHHDRRQGRSTWGKTSQSHSGG